MPSFHKIWVACLLFITACQPKSNTTEPLPYYNSPDFSPIWVNSTDARPDSLHRLAAFSFRNQNNKLVSEQTVKGKIHVADFFFTRCPGLCPRLTQSMSEIQAAFRTDPGVLLVSYSVTPERDSVPQLRQYATQHQVIDGKWHLLTGDHDAIYRLARKSYFADEKPGCAKRRKRLSAHRKSVINRRRPAHPGHL